MATIDDLNLSISNMSTEELNQRILDLRKSRRIPKKITKTKTKASKPADLSTIMATMSKDDLEALIASLEETN